jgi:hypothetical protein
MSSDTGSVLVMIAVAGEMLGVVWEHAKPFVFVVFAGAGGFLLYAIVVVLGHILSELRSANSLLRDLNKKLESGEVREISVNLDQIRSEFNWWDTKKQTFAREILSRLDRTP